MIVVGITICIVRIAVIHVRVRHIRMSEEGVSVRIIGVIIIIQRRGRVKLAKIFIVMVIRGGSEHGIHGIQTLLFGRVTTLAISIGASMEFSTTKELTERAGIAIQAIMNIHILEENSNVLVDVGNARRICCYAVLGRGGDAMAEMRSMQALAVHERDLVEENAEETIFFCGEQWDEGSLEHPGDEVISRRKLSSVSQ